MIRKQGTDKGDFLKRPKEKERSYGYSKIKRYRPIVPDTLYYHTTTLVFWCGSEAGRSPAPECQTEIIFCAFPAPECETEIILNSLPEGPATHTVAGGEAAPIIPQNARHVKLFLHKKGNICSLSPFPTVTCFQSSLFMPLAHCVK